MEHRYEARKPLVTDVVIKNHDQMPLLGQTRNISLGGMFVDMEYTQLPVNAFVNATVFLVENKRLVSFCTPAYVIHTKESGAGLMFIELNAAATQSLHYLLSSKSA